MILFLRKYKEIVLYLVFGGLTTAINFIVYLFASWAVGLSAWTSHIIAWVVAVSFAYVVNKIFVFESKERSKKGLFRESALFVAARVFSLAVSTAVMYIFVDYMALNELLFLTVTQVFTIVFNYAASKWVVFKDKTKTNS